MGVCEFHVHIGISCVNWGERFLSVTFYSNLTRQHSRLLSTTCSGDSFRTSQCMLQSGMTSMLMATFAKHMSIPVHSALGLAQKYYAGNRRHRFDAHRQLRCVVAVIRHGDRTPKQKIKGENSGKWKVENSNSRPRETHQGIGERHSLHKKMITWCHIITNLSWIHYEFIMNSSRIHHEWITNSSWIHHKFITKYLSCQAFTIHYSGGGSSLIIRNFREKWRFEKGQRQVKESDSIEGISCDDSSNRRESHGFQSLVNEDQGRGGGKSGPVSDHWRDKFKNMTRQKS